MLIRNLVAAAALFCLIFISIIGLCVQYSGDTASQLVSVLILPGRWMRVHHDAIEAISALCSFVFSIALVVFTAVLAHRTTDLFRETKRLAETNINQVDLARAEFNSTHRPKIRLKHLVIATDIWSDRPIIVSLTCVNYGAVDALLLAIGLRYYVVGTDHELPIEPDIPTVIPGGGLRMKPGLNRIFPSVDVGYTLSPEDNRRVQGASLNCIALGTSAIETLLKKPATGFCRVLVFPALALTHIGNCRFLTFPDPDYQYED